MNKTTTPDVTISKVARSHAWWVYFMPFQCWREFRSTIVILALGLLVVGVIIYRVDPEGLEQVLTCSAIGGVYVGVYGALPARLTLATRSEARHHFADLQARLVKGGYVASDEPVLPGSYHYRSKFPRWLSWDSQDIRLVVRDHEIVLTGPINPLRLLRVQLLRTEDHAYVKA